MHLFHFQLVLRRQVYWLSGVVCQEEKAEFDQRECIVLD